MDPLPILEVFKSKKYIYYNPKLKNILLLFKLILKNYKNLLHFFQNKFN